MTPAQLRVLTVLAALVVAMAAATAAVFLMLGRDGDTSSGRASAAAQEPATATLTPLSSTPLPTETGTTTPIRTPTPRRGVTVRASSAANVRAGPGVGFAVITILQAGDETRAIGRNADASWLLIELDGGTGWVAADVVEITGELAALPLSEVTGAVRPSPTAPSLPLTRTPTPVVTRPPTPTPTIPPSTPTVTGSPALTAGPPDLVLQDVVVGAAGRITVIIANAGPGPLTGRRVSVVGIDDAGAAVFGELTPPLTLPAGSAVNVELTFRTTTTLTLTVVLNADGAVEELTLVNNRRRVTLRP